MSLCVTQSERSGKRWRHTCRVCGKVRVTDQPQCYGPCGASAAASREFLLGDLTEAVIKYTGAEYSYKLVRSWVERIPVNQLPCFGCSARKRWLNDISRRFVRWAKG